MSDKLNLIDTIASHGKFSTFTRLMASSGTNSVFEGAGDFTVFAPTNDAFAKIPDNKINELLNETGQVKLKTLLSYHILPGKVMAANLGSKTVRDAFSGHELTFSDNSGLQVNGASVQARNLEAKNGVVHALESVLAPFPLASAATSTPQTKLSAVPNAQAATASASPAPTMASAASTITSSELHTDTKPLL